MHAGKRKRLEHDRVAVSMAGKVAVMGLLERHGKDGSRRFAPRVVAERPEARHLQGHRPQARRSRLHCPHRCALVLRRTGTRDYVHNVIDHAEAYVDGNVHTNGCENFWSLLKRAIKGTYVSVEPFHLFRYLDEQAFRFNNRGGN